MQNDGVVIEACIACANAAAFVGRLNGVMQSFAKHHQCIENRARPAPFAKRKSMVHKPEPENCQFIDIHQFRSD